MTIPSRTAMSRAANSRPAIGGANGAGVLDVDLTGLDTSSYEFMWATASVLGQDAIETNVRIQMSHRGFLPVLASELPGAAAPLLPGESRPEHALVRRGGAILMKRPRHLGEEERLQLRRDNRDALRGVTREADTTLRDNGIDKTSDFGVQSQREVREERARPRQGRQGEFSDE
jgi:hypothetical protein